MITLEYPSKDFQREALELIEEGKTFCVSARLGKFRKNSLKDYINKMFQKRGGRFSYVGVAMCGTLGAITANAFVSGKYRAEYADIDKRILITFKSLKRTNDVT